MKKHMKAQMIPHMFDPFVPISIRGFLRNLELVFGTVFTRVKTCGFFTYSWEILYLQLSAHDLLQTPRQGGHRNLPASGKLASEKVRCWWDHCGEEDSNHVICAYGRNETTTLRRRVSFEDPPMLKGVWEKNRPQQNLQQSFGLNYPLGHELVYGCQEKRKNEQSRILCEIAAETKRESKRNVFSKKETSTSVRETATENQFYI